MSDYERIARAIKFLRSHVRQQPSLDEVAAHLNLSAFHFQRLFSRWAGVTPKKFLQILTLEHAKTLLQEPASLLDVSDQLGLGSSSRLYDHFVKLEAMTPGEYRAAGMHVSVEWGLHDSPFGLMFIAMTERGICRIAFSDDDRGTGELARLLRTWPSARLQENTHRTAGVASAMFQQAGEAERPLSLLVSGTNFQVQVWRALLDISPGNVTSYSRLANSIGHPGSARAVGTAIAANPVALLIPCHRVIRKNGDLGDYRWGIERKHALLARESAARENENNREDSNRE